jgi:protein-tyrosine phosphatase
MKGYTDTEQQYTKLKEEAYTLFPDMSIFRGNEFYYEDDCVSNWIEKGKACSMEHSKYILFEFNHYCASSTIEHALLSVLDKGWWPILAHAERYPQFHRDFAVFERLNKNGVYMQINAYSLNEEKDLSIKNCARQLAAKELAHFIGSDAHKDYHRPPSLRSGVDYLYGRCRKEYVDDLIQGNAERILQGVRI